MKSLTKTFLSIGLTLGGVSITSPILAATLNFDGTSSASAAAGTGTTPAQVKSADKYAKRYDGRTQFKGDYDIVFNPDNTVNSANSTIKFTTLIYSSGGIEKKSNFITEAINITEVKLINNDPNMIESFKFEATNWYPSNATGAGGLKDQKLNGSIDLKTGKSSYIASYAFKSNNAIVTYKVDAMIEADKPFPDPLPDEFGNPEIFAPVPEPLTLLGASTALGFGAFFKRKLKHPK